jgi:hypothetical protein
MAKSFLTDLNLNNNVLLNAKIQAWGSAPTGTTNPSGSGTAVAGQISSYNGALYIFNGTAWTAVGGGSVTIGSTSVNVNGSAVTTFTGLSSVTSTTFVGALTGNASTASALTPGANINGVGFTGASNSTVKASTTYTLGLTAQTNSGLAFSSGTTWDGGTTGITIGLATTGTAGTYTKVTTNAYGQITSGTTLSSSDIPSLGSITNAGKIGSTGSNIITTGSDGTLTAATALPNGITATTQTSSDNSTKVATTAYVDTAVSTLASGVNAHDAVKYATTANLGTAGNITSGGTITVTYNNNTTGVGATITVASTTNWTVITIDGQSLTVGDRVLIKNQGDSPRSQALENGIYTVTQVGTTGNSTSFIFTRATDNDSVPELGQGDLTYVIAGSANAANSYVQTAVVTTVGSSSITWSQFSGPGTYTFSSPLSLLSNTVSLSTAYGDTQNPYGSKTANTFLASPNGSAAAPSFRAIVAADIPTLNQSTTGSAATLTTSRSLWGQSFNGSADITGNLSSVGTITGTTGTTLTIALPSTTGTATGVILRGGASSSTTLGIGGSVSIVGGAATSGTSTNVGGDVTITGGAANTTQGTGGSVTINGGAGEVAASVGGQGVVYIGTSNTQAITIGASGNSLRLPGVATASDGFVKIAATTGLLSRGAILFSDLPTSSLTGVTTTGIARKTTGAGTGTGTSISVNHGYGQWVHAQLFDSSGNLVEVDVQNTATSNGTTIFTFASSQTLTGFQYVIIG